MKDISIVIVSWNVEELLLNFIKSIFNNTKDIDFEIIVVDNASKDWTVDKIKWEFAREIKNGNLKILAQQENLGFAKANNLGWKAAKGKYIWFLNPDMKFIDDSIGKMINYIKQDQNIGALGSTLLYPDKSIQPTVKNFPKISDQILILLKLHHFIKTKSLKKYLAKNFDYTQTQEVDQLMGACILTRKNILEKINGWDEDYWLWWEDVDICKRIKKQGYKIVYSPISQIIHYEGKSFEQVPSLDKQKRFNKGMRIYFKKHHGLVSYIILSVLSPVSLFLAWLSQLFKVKPKPQSRI